MKRILLSVNAGIVEGYKVHVEFKDEMTALDAVAAIRGLVDRTAQVTGWSPEKILGLVEKQVIAFDADLPRIVGVRA